MTYAMDNFGDRSPYLLAKDEDSPLRALWIVHPRCGSLTITATVRKFGKVRMVERAKAQAANDGGLFTIAVIRHPFDRAVSALHSYLTPNTPYYEANFPQMSLHKNPIHDINERLEHFLKADDPMVRPQYPALQGMRVDFTIRFQHFDEDWKALCKMRDYGERQEHHRQHRRPDDWRGVCDWPRFLPWYEQDFTLCDEWAKE